MPNTGSSKYKKGYSYNTKLENRVYFQVMGSEKHYTGVKKRGAHAH